jgi:hypothetical protein
VWLSPQLTDQPGQRQPLFRPDHVHDALPRVVEAETGDAMGLVLCSSVSIMRAIAGVPGPPRVGA